jgi:hypothetical protein
LVAGQESGMTDSTEVQVAKMTLEYWDKCTLEAAKVHPNWKVTEDGGVQWLGGRTGPRTPNGLLNWYLRTYPEECACIRERVAALHVFRHSGYEGIIGSA